MDYIEKASPQTITKLKENEIFVFGSNLQGIHSGGSARQALVSFGAKYGQGEGLQGQSYAIPTKRDMKTALDLEEVRLYIDRFMSIVRLTQDKIFLVTEIGCRHAGMKVEDVGPLFAPYIKVSNLLLPQRFLDEIYHSMGYKKLNNE
jgi:hypothetical protein